MSLRINNNLSALNALRNLNLNDDKLARAISRLSTGLKINTGADDPAGLTISENFRAQISGIERAVQNSQDAINMVKTAEGALAEVQTLLLSMRGLAVHSANTGVVDQNVLSANQAQIRSVIQSINRIAEHTAFGTKKLLDGTAGVQASVTDSSLASSIFMGGTFNGNPILTGPVTVTLTTPAERALLDLTTGYADANAIVPAGSFTINGASFATDGTETLTQVVSKINQMSNTTGVTATIAGSGPVNVQLVQNSYGSKFDIQLFDTSGLLNGSSYASDAGVDAIADVSVTTSEGVETVQFTGGQGLGDSGLRLSDSFGNAITLTENANQNFTGPGQVGVVTAGSVQIQFGPSSNQMVQLAVPSMFADSLGTGVVPSESIATLDITTQQGANDAIKIIDAAVAQLARTRGDLGSFQKDFLESNVRSLGIARENLVATESSIRDADMAEEMTQYTKYQILQQSGMAVLAQANQLPQSVLRLLQQ
ncbi:MAG: flagellin [Fimbriimonadales bacterium]